METPAHVHTPGSPGSEHSFAYSQTSDVEAPEEGEASDCSVEDIPQPRKPRGRPRRGAGSGSGAGSTGRRGGHGARGMPTPPSAGGARPERQARPRRQPASYAKEQSEKQAAERKRRREVKEATIEHVPDEDAHISLRATCESIARELSSGCCKASIVPIAPNRIIGSAAVALRFKCSGCSRSIEITMHQTVRLNKLLQEELDEEEDAEDEPETRRRKRRKTTNSRPDDAVRAVIAALLTGKMYIDLKKDAIAKKLPYMHKKSRTPSTATSASSRPRSRSRRRRRLSSCATWSCATVATSTSWW